MITQRGTRDNPYDLGPFATIIRVSWPAGGVGILQVDFPDGVLFNWIPPSMQPDAFPSSVTGQFTIAQLDAISHSNVFGIDIGKVGEVYPEEPATLQGWRVNQPDIGQTILGGTYEMRRDSFLAFFEGSRWIEVGDLRTLADNEVPFPGLLYTPPPEWITSPTGTWANYPFYGDHGPPDFIPGYLPPASSPIGVWGIGELPDFAGSPARNLERHIYILNFNKFRIAGSIVTIENRNPEHDPRLASYDVQFNFKKYPNATRFTKTLTSVIADKSHIFNQTKTMPYDQVGSIMLNRKGFL